MLEFVNYSTSSLAATSVNSNAVWQNPWMPTLDWLLPPAHRIDKISVGRSPITNQAEQKQ